MLNQMISMLGAPKAAPHEPTPVIDTIIDEDHEEDAEEDEDEDDEAEASENENKSDKATAKDKSSKTKNTPKKKQKNRWVRQLLNQQVEKKRDRAPVARKKHHHAPLKSKGPARPPTFLTIVNTLNSALVAQILLFLEIRQPAAVCSYVNKACEAHVRAFYEHHCPHPRPRRYLAKKLFNTVENRDHLLTKVLSFLDIKERMNASSCCQTLFQASNALALTINGSRNATQFVECVSTERVKARFSATSVLELGTMLRQT